MSGLKTHAKIKELLQKSEIVFWDFDGVIKETVKVKSDGFEQLFLRYGKKLAQRVRLHHEEHGGISRYEKIPIYLGWANETPSSEKIEDYCRQFSGLVFDAVIKAPWVPGVREYLQDHYNDQYFVLISATPNDEIHQILQTLEISYMFGEIYGAPVPKSTAIQGVLDRLKCLPGKTVVVGDSESDMQAALDTDIEFVLRKTEYNFSLQQKHDGFSFNNLADAP